MCCEIFWKRIVTLCITFGLGVFISDFFVLKELPSIEPVEIVEEKFIPLSQVTEMSLISKQKNCEAADKSLNYQSLSQEEVIIPVPKNKERENNPQTSKESTANKLKNRLKEIDKELNKDLEHKLHYQILLYKENCYESNGRK